MKKSWFGDDQCHGLFGICDAGMRASKPSSPLHRLFRNMSPRGVTPGARQQEN